MSELTRPQAEKEFERALGAGESERAMEMARHLDALSPRSAHSLRGAALWYAEQLVPVFPLRPGSKIPYAGSRGVHEATCDLARVADWWQQHPEANIGLATGWGIDAIDFDGPDAHAAWGERYPGGWEDAGVHVLATVSTPRPGGFHVYLPTPPTKPGNLANFVPKVDYRGLGGYVVAPPSLTDVGRYTFLRALDPLELAELRGGEPDGTWAL